MSGFIRVSGTVWRRAAVANAYIVCVVASAVPMTIAGYSYAVSGRATRKYGLEQYCPPHHIVGNDRAGGSSARRKR